MRQIHRRVLLVEDDDSVALLVERVLSRIGIQTTHVGTAEQALGYLAETSWDGMLADIWLPGMSGLDLTKTAREADERVPIAIMTADPSSNLRQEAYRSGANDFLAKPLSSQGLTSAIQRLFDADG